MNRLDIDQAVFLLNKELNELGVFARADDYDFIILNLQAYDEYNRKLSRSEWSKQSEIEAKIKLIKNSIKEFRISHPSKTV